MTLLLQKAFALRSTGIQADVWWPPKTAQLHWTSQCATWSRIMRLVRVIHGESGLFLLVLNGFFGRLIIHFEGHLCYVRRLAWCLMISQVARLHWSLACAISYRVMKSACQVILLPLNHRFPRSHEEFMHILNGRTVWKLSTSRRFPMTLAICLRLWKQSIGVVMILCCAFDMRGLQAE